MLKACDVASVTICTDGWTHYKHDRVCESCTDWWRPMHSIELAWEGYVKLSTTGAYDNKQYMYWSS